MKGPSALHVCQLHKLGHATGSAVALACVRHTADAQSIRLKQRMLLVSRGGNVAPTYGYTPLERYGKDIPVTTSGRENIPPGGNFKCTLQHSAQPCFALCVHAQTRSPGRQILLLRRSGKLCGLHRQPLRKHEARCLMRCRQTTP